MRLPTIGWDRGINTPMATCLAYTLITLNLNFRLSLSTDPYTTRAILTLVLAQRNCCCHILYQQHSHKQDSRRAGGAWHVLLMCYWSPVPARYSHQWLRHIQSRQSTSAWIVWNSMKPWSDGLSLCLYITHSTTVDRQTLLDWNVLTRASRWKHSRCWTNWSPMAW